MSGDGPDDGLLGGLSVVANSRRSDGTALPAGAVEASRLVNVPGPDDGAAPPDGAANPLIGLRLAARLGLGLLAPSGAADGLDPAAGAAWSVDADAAADGAAFDFDCCSGAGA